MSENQRQSYSFTLRACPSDTNIIELINYLRSLGRSVANRQIEDALMKTLLSLAKLHSGKYSAEELRLSCLNSCESLSSHSNYLRQAFNIADLQHWQSNTPRLSQQAPINSNADLNGAEVPSSKDSVSFSVKADNKVTDALKPQKAVESSSVETSTSSPQTEDLVAIPSGSEANLISTKFNF